MKVYETNIKNILIAVIFSSFLCAEISFTTGVSYGGVTYNEVISGHMNITNGIGFNGALEKSIGNVIVGAGYLHQTYVENFDSQVFDSSFKNTVTANYLTGHVIYPYEINRFRFWGGIQFGQCINGKMIREENQVETETTTDSDNYKLDYGILVGTDIMFTKHIGTRFSYYYGIAKILSTDVALDSNISNLNVMNVGTSAQLLFRF